MTPCPDITAQLSNYAAGELDAAAAKAVTAHLARCPDCAADLDRLRRAEFALRRALGAAIPCDVDLRVRATLADETRRVESETLMTLEEAARFLRLDPSRMDDVLDDLPALEVAGEIRIRRRALLAWIRGKERQFERQRLQSRVARELTSNGGLAG